MNGLGIALQILLWVSLAATIVGLLLLVAERSAATDVIEDGRIVNFDFQALSDLDDAGTAVDVMTVLLAFLGLAILVLLIIFCWRGAKNLEALGRAGPPLSTGWAIGAWFVPIAAVILVPIVWAGIWKGLDPTVPPGEPRWRRAPLSALLVLWWVAWPIGSTVAGIGGSLRSEDETGFIDPATYVDGITTAIVGYAIVVAAITFAAVTVRALTKRAALWTEHLAGWTATSSGPPATASTGWPSPGGDEEPPAPPPPPIISG